MTGLNDEQLTDLVARLHELCGDKFVSAGPPLALGLFRSVALVVCLMRKNVTQDFAGAVFGVSQPTVSRRWDLLRPLIGDALAEVVPDPAEVVGRGTVLVDGTVCPTWDWRHVPDLFSAKAGYPGMNLQIAATLDGALARGRPGPGARRPPRRVRLRRVRAGRGSHRLPHGGRSGLRRRRGNRHRPVQAIPRHRPQPRPGRVQHLARARPAPPSNMPSRTSRHGECSAKKAAATELRWRSTRACSKRSSDYSSLRPMNKPPGMSVSRACR